MEDVSAPVSALYIHIPFCERKCEYCDFVSVAGAKGQHAYVGALRSELRALATVLDGCSLRTIFCGGGTPGLLDLSLLSALMTEVRDCFAVTADAEITLEVNPSSTSPARALAWRTAGFNRVSVGIQSTHDDVLAFLGRVHDGRRALAALADVQAAGFDNVSGDLIYAVPGLDDARWRRSLEQVVDAGPTHVSAYELTVESGTPLHRSVATGRVRVVDPDAALRQHRIAVADLGAAGYRQYEVSNFARSGWQCEHNLVYWRNGYYAAAGVGAHGHLPATMAPAFSLLPPVAALSFRYEHGRSVEAYVQAVATDPLAVSSAEWIDAGMRAEEGVMLGLRLHEGVTVAGDALVEARLLADAGFVVLDGRRARVTERGEDVLNQVALRIATGGV